MARLRKGSAYRLIERAYTRVSKYKRYAYIKARPNSKIVRFNMGNAKKNFTHTLELKADRDVNLRHNCIESARQAANRKLEPLGKQNFYLHILVYPHHILRENPLASGAGADRFSTGMKKAFGKPMSSAARVKKDQTIFEARVDEPNIKVAKEALTRMRHKLPCSCSIVITKN